MKRSFRPCPALAFLAALALAACSKNPSSPSGSGLLSGTVVDSAAGAAVPGAMVVVGSADSAATGADGRFSFTLAEGRYTVQVSKDGYYGVAANVPVLAGDTTVITVYTRLRPWTPGAAMPEARHNFGTAAVLNEVFLLAGVGVSGGGVTRYSSLLSYIPSSSLWTTSGLAPMSVHRELPACAALGSDIYAFGGSVGTGDTALCQAYSTLLNSWTNLAPPPTPCRASAAVAVGDSIFIIGGFIGAAATDSVWTYNPSADTAGGAPWGAAANMPGAPKGGLSAAVVNGLVYVFGGITGGAAQNTVYKYDPANNSWSSKTPMPAARAYMACGAYGGRVYLFGGLDAGTARSSSFRYDPSTNTWTTLEDMPLARYGAGAAAVGNRIYVFGGFDGANSLGVVEVYNPAADLK